MVRLPYEMIVTQFSVNWTSLEQSTRRFTKSMAKKDYKYRTYAELPIPSPLIFLLQMSKHNRQKAKAKSFEELYGGARQYTLSRWWQDCTLTYPQLLLIAYHLHVLWNWIRWGEITSRPMAIDACVISEIEYRDRFDRVIGYWAYGSWDPASAYKGDPVKPIIIRGFNPELYCCGIDYSLYGHSSISVSSAFSYDKSDGSIKYLGSTPVK